MKKVETETDHELRPEYDLRDLRVRKLGRGRKSFGDMTSSKPSVGMVNTNIERKIICAIGKLLERDVTLLQTDANERSISHKLAEYLQEQFEDWHVDCEYNRNCGSIKRLNVSLQDGKQDTTESRTVLPDIIVHRRGTTRNLLVIEIKKSTNPNDGNSDKQKLKDFISSPFNYQYGLFIRFKTGQDDAFAYELEWFMKAEPEE